MLSTSRLRGDDFYLLSEHRSAYDARVELLDAAQCEINIAYYAIDSGDVALSLISHVHQAALRGVRVRILLDGLRSRLPSELENLLLEEGVELHAYHPVASLNPLWLNRRIHYKLLVVDQQAMIVGSRNLEDAHFGMNQGENFFDMDALFLGEVCQRAAEHFDELWNSDEVKLVKPTRNIGCQNHRTAALQLLEQAVKRVAACESFTDGPSQSCIDPCIEDVECMQLIHDRGTDKSSREYQKQVIAMIDSAKQRLWIQTPYPVLERPVKDAIKRAIDRGVQATLFTNSLGAADRTGTYAAYQNDKREYLRIGLKLVEYTGKDTMHAKSIVIDDCISLIGSYNMDARSDRLNLEFGVLVHDPRVCKLIEHELRYRMQIADRVETNSLALPQVIRGNASLFKRSQMRTRQLWIPLLRSSL